MNLRCGAGDGACGLFTGKSILLQAAGPRVLDCDICCGEAGFCRECRCLLCGGKIRKKQKRRHQWIQCHQVIGRNDAGMCGHSAHLKCAVDCRMGGVVFGEDGELMLDCEYLCRRCDEKSDLENHLVLLIRVAEQASKAAAEKGFKLALRLVQGTNRSATKCLEILLNKIIEEAQDGGDIRNLFKEYRDQALAADAAKKKKMSHVSGSSGDGMVQIECPKQVLEARSSRNAD